MLYTTCVTLCSEFEWPIPARYQHASEDVILTVLYRDIVSKMGVFTSLDTSMRVFDLEEFHWEQSSKVISPRDGEVFIRFIVRATASISGVPLASKTDHHALFDTFEEDVTLLTPVDNKGEPFLGKIKSHHPFVTIHSIEEETHVTPNKN